MTSTLKRLIPGLTLLAVLITPALAYAQLMYETLTLIEAAYLQIGLDIQHLLRNNSSLINLPPAITIAGTLYLMLKRVTSANPEPFIGVGMYFVTTMFITVIFWPEAIGGIVGTGTSVRVNPTQIRSSIAAADPNASSPDHAVTADDANIRNFIGFSATGGTRVPVFFDTVLRAAIQTPMVLGRTINANLNRPHDRATGFQQLLNYKMPSPPSGIPLSEFMTNCYGQALAIYQQTPQYQGSTFAWTDTLPWQAPLEDYLDDVPAYRVPQMRRRPGSYRAATVEWDGWPPGTKDYTMKCDSLYTNAIEGELIRQLQTRQTPRGQSIGQAIQDSAGMPIQDQARFLIYREMRRHLPALVESRNKDRILNKAAVLFGIKAATDAVSKGGIAGFFTGLASALTGGVSMSIDAVLAFMKPAIALLMFMPYITGMLSATVLGLFPVVVLWSLFPGQHFKPIINYFLVLLFTQSAPLWYAISDALADAAFNQFGGSVGGSFWNAVGLQTWLQGQSAGTLVAVLATFLVPAAEAILLFGTWRAVSGALKGV